MSESLHAAFRPREAAVTLRAVDNGITLAAASGAVMTVTLVDGSVHTVSIHSATLQNVALTEIAMDRTNANRAAVVRI